MQYVRIHLILHAFDTLIAPKCSAYKMHVAVAALHTSLDWLRIFGNW